MTTLRQLLDDADAALFVGRADELSRARSWLDETSPSILNVTGPGGIGKSAFTRACTRMAADAGLAVHALDGDGVGTTADSLLHALGGGSVDEVVARFAAAPSLLVIDGFEHLAPLARFVKHDLLPSMPASTRVLVAGRQPLRWAHGSGWQGPVVELVLGGLSPSEAREYLRRRGIEAEDARTVAAAAGGLPLALALAGDLAAEVGAQAIATGADWRDVVRTLSERLLADVEDPELPSLLEAAALLRHFDEDLLLDVAGPLPADAFRRLTRLSLVQATDRGLQLHQDVRTALAQDLRHRRPQRYAELRDAALAALRRRMARSPEDLAGRLVADQLYLLDDELVRSRFFSVDVPGTVKVVPATTADHADVRRLWFAWLDRIDGIGPADPEVEDAEHAWLDAFLAHPATDLDVVRLRDGRVTGYLATAPIARDSLDVLSAHPFRGPAVRRLVEDDHVELPDTWRDSRVHYLLQMGWGAEAVEATSAALLRAAIAMIGRGGAFLASPVPAEHVALCRLLGFAEVAPPEFDFRGMPVHTMLLDLDRIGVGRWIDAVVNRRPIPSAAHGRPPTDLVHEALQGWYDDPALASCGLATAISPPTGDAAGRAEAVRDVLREAFADARAAAEDDLPFRAAELAYLRRAAPHEALATRLSVSRSTFYRLLRRAVSATADHLPPHI